MRVETNPAFSGDGRIRGSYVYALVCGGAGSVHIKIGKSDDPISRMRSLVQDCRKPPHTLATIHLVTSEEAYAFEAILHEKLKRWRTRGEWFEFAPADKKAFNEACDELLRKYSKPSWPLKWSKLDAKPFLVSAKPRQPVRRCLR